MNIEQASRTHFADALKVLVELNDFVAMAESLVGLATVAQAMDEPEQAANLLGATMAISEDHHTPLSSDTRNKMTPMIEAVCVTLGEARYAAAWVRGRNLTLEQVIDQALERVN